MLGGGFKLSEGPRQLAVITGQRSLDADGGSFAGFGSHLGLNFGFVLHLSQFGSFELFNYENIKW